MSKTEKTPQQGEAPQGQAQQGQQQGQTPRPAPQQGQTPIFRDWASI
jgi:hypothetical protein